MPSFRSLVVPALLAAMASASPLAMMNTMDPRAVSTCMDGTVNDTDVQLALYYGGAGTTVSLCPGAVINFYNPVQFTAENQEVSTEGYPTGSSRATIIVMGQNQATAFNMACGWWCRGGVLRNIQINGNRPALGKIDGASALIEVGGDSGNHLITQMNLYEPRGWSCLHVNEGYQTMCRNVTITQNQVGPSGNSPNTGNQFVQIMKNYKNFLGLAPKVPGSLGKRYETSTYNPGLWADGISLSCGASTVTDNVITDATDGGIVIFGSPGSVVANNHIRSVNRNLLGGINMVDWGPWSGNFTDVVVEGNTIEAQSAMIKIGVAMGVLSWGSYNNSAFYNYGGTVRNNKFIASNQNNGYFGFHISIAGHNDVSVSGNDVSESFAGGALTPACIPAPYAPPTPAMSNALVYDPWTSNGSVSSDFVQQTLVFLICTGPSQPDPPGQAFPDDAGPNYTGGSNVVSSTQTVSSVTSVSSAAAVSSTAAVSSSIAASSVASRSTVSSASSVSSVSSVTSTTSRSSTSTQSSVTTSTSKTSTSTKSTSTTTTSSSSTKQSTSTTSSTKTTSSTSAPQTTSTKTTPSEPTAKTTSPDPSPTKTVAQTTQSQARPSVPDRTPSLGNVVSNVPTIVGNNKSAATTKSTSTVKSTAKSSSSVKTTSKPTTSTKLIVAKSTRTSTVLVKSTTTKDRKVLVETSAKKVTSVYKTTATERFVADKLVRTVTVVHPTTYMSLRGDEKVRMVKTMTSLSTTLVPTTTAKPTSTTKKSSSTSKKSSTHSSTHSTAKPTQSTHRRAVVEDEEELELLRRDFAVAATPTLGYVWTPPGGAQPTRR